METQLNLASVASAFAGSVVGKTKKINVGRTLTEAQLSAVRRQLGYDNPGLHYDIVEDGDQAGFYHVRATQVRFFPPSVVVR